MPDFLKRGELVLFGRFVAPSSPSLGGRAGGFCFSLLLKEHAFILNNPVTVLESVYIFLVRSLSVSTSVTL